MTNPFLIQQPGVSYNKNTNPFLQKQEGVNYGSDEQRERLTSFGTSKTQEVINKVVAQPVQQEATQEQMTEAELFAKVDNAIASGDFGDMPDEEVFQGIRQSIIDDGITIQGYTPPNTTLTANNEVEEIQGLDVGVKLGTGISDFAKEYKFQSNVDDGIIESGLKFLGNLPQNTAQIAGDLISIASNPVGTVQSINTLGKAMVETGLNKLFMVEGQEKWTSEEVKLVSESVSKELGRIANEPGRIKELLIENPADVLLTVTGGLGVAKNVAKSKNMTGLASKIETLERATNPIKIQAEAVKLAGKATKKITGKTGELIAQGVTKTTGMNFDTVKTIVKQPELFKQAETGKITRKSVADEVVSAIDKKASDISDLGKEYGTIRKLKSNITPDDIKVLKGNITKTLADNDIELVNGKLDFSNSQIGQAGNRKAIQDAYNLINSRTKFDEGKDWLNLRQSIDDTINYKSEATTRGQNIVRSIRAEVDNIAKTKLEGLEKLDKKFAPERKEFSRINELIRKKDGDLKDNYISTVANITGKGKELKLERIEKIIPNIKAQVSALKAMEDVALAKGTKVGTYMNAASLGVGGIAGGIPGAIAAYIITHPSTLIGVLKAYTGSKTLINSIVKKVKEGVKLTKEESKVVGAAIKEQALEKGANLADDLADKVGARSKFMDDSGKSLDDFKITYGNKTAKELSKVDDIDVFYDEMPKGIPEIAYELKLLDYPTTREVIDIFQSPNYTVKTKYGKEYLNLRNKMTDFENEFIEFANGTGFDDFYKQMQKLEKGDLSFNKVGTTKSAGLIEEAKIPSYLRLYKNDIIALDKADNPKSIVSIVKKLGQEGETEVFTDFPQLKAKYIKAKKDISIQKTPMNRAETGKPIQEKLYHGTNSNFDVVDSKFSNKSSGTGVGKGHIFYTDDKNVAKSYGKNIKETNVKLENPLVIDAEGSNWNDIMYKKESRNINEIANIAEKEGYDGLIVKSVRDTGGFSDKPGGFTESTSIAKFSNK